MAAAAAAGGITIAGLLVGAPAALASTDTWSGAGAAASGWSSGTNWSGGAAPVSGEALVFPALASCGATACYSSIDTLNTLTVPTLSIADDRPYTVSSVNGSLTLSPPSGTDGLVAATSSTTTGAASGSAYDVIPTQLGTSQQWSVSGNGLGSGSLTLGEPVTGAPHTLAVTLGSQAQLTFEGGESTGGLQLIGAAPGAMVANGQVLLTGTANAGPVLADDVGLTVGTYSGAVTKIGALTVQDGALTVGSDGPNGPGTVQVSGTVSIDANSTTTVQLEGTGTAAGSDYAELTASGNVQLAGRLQLSDEGAATVTCAAVGSGGVITFLSTTGGTISGQFTGLPNGAVTEIVAHCDGTTESYPVAIHYGPTSVTGTFVMPVVTSTAVAASAMSVAVGGAVTLTATVTPAALGTPAPAGAVEFLIGTTPLNCSGAGDGVLNGGGPDVARCTITTSTVGSYPITAVYAGDGQYSGSASSALGVTVTTPTSGSPTTSHRRTRGGTGSFRITMRYVQVRAVRVRVSCARGGESCVQTLRVTMVIRVRHGRRTVRRTIVIGSRRVRVAAGRSHLATVGLNATGRRLLARRHVLRAHLLVQRRFGRRTRTLSSEGVIVVVRRSGHGR